MTIGVEDFLFFPPPGLRGGPEWYVVLIGRGDEGENGMETFEVGGEEASYICIRCLACGFSLLGIGTLGVIATLRPKERKQERYIVRYRTLLYAIATPHLTPVLRSSCPSLPALPYLPPLPEVSLL